MRSEVRKVISNYKDLLRNICNNSAKDEKELCKMEQRESPQSKRMCGVWLGEKGQVGYALSRYLLSSLRLRNSWKGLVGDWGIWQWIYLWAASVYKWWTLYSNRIPLIKPLSGPAKPFSARSYLCGVLSHIIALPRHRWHAAIERP